MIIKETKGLEVENIGGNTESIEAGINAASMPFLFEMLSKSLYSNPIGSICREITSNCFDSHTEVGVDDAVVVRKGNDEEGTYISFVDFGVGLNPERINNIYMNYFSSTKRETNDQIGGFGLGSKSPLSYAEYFYINTISDGIKYQYIFSRGERLPTLDLMDKTETTERNGTEIRIYIKDRYDVTKFEEELKKQLCYFDNVYFEGWNIENNYTIFEGEHFKFRNKNQYDKEMHIVLGKVAYPIDWEQLGISAYNIAVGVKFEIGELLVTPNREQLRYTDEIITLVQQRINHVIDELTGIFNKQNEAFDSFFAWYNKKTEKPFIMFQKEGEAPDKLYLYGLEHVNKRHTYKYFEGLEDIVNLPDIVGLFFTFLGSVINKKKDKDSYNVNVTETISRGNRHNNHISMTPYMSAEKDWLIEQGDVFCPKITYAFKKHGANMFLKLSKEHIPKGGYSNRSDAYYFNLGAGLKIYKLMKAIQSEVIQMCGEYRELNQEELQEYREEKRQNDANLQRRLNGKVFVKSLTTNQNYDWKVMTDKSFKPSSKKDNHKYFGIEDFKGLVIYGFRDDVKALEKSITLLSQVRKKYFYSNSNTNWKPKAHDKILKVIQINKQNEKYFKGRKNMVHVNNLYGDNALFRAMASSFKIEQFFDDIKEDNEDNTIVYIQHMKNICQDIGDTLEELYKYYKETNINERAWNVRYERSDIRREVMKVAREKNLYDPAVELLFNKVEEWFKGVELIRYMKINEKTLPYILKFLYENKKRLNLEYYQKIMDTGKLVQLEIDFEPKEIPELTKFQIITQNVA